MKSTRIQLFKKIIVRTLILLLVFSVSFYVFSPRLRQHIAFNYNQVEILIQLRGQEEIHQMPDFNQGVNIVKDSSLVESVLNELLANNMLSSQRLIYAYHEHLNLNYKSYLFLDHNPENKLPDPGSALNGSVLSKTHNYYEFGLGGVQLFPSVLINFKSTYELNDYLRNLRDKYSVYKDIELEGSTYLIKLSPFFFIDWYWYPVGINSNVVLAYDDVTYENINNKIVESEINGVFGPNIDYRLGIENDFDKIVEFTKEFVKNDKIAFAKHFGYREALRVSVTGSSLDPHYEQVRIITKDSIFVNEDLKIYNGLMNEVNSEYLGVMIGHHILDPIDSIKMANSSSRVLELARSNSNGLFISDAIGMFGFLKGGDFKDLVPDIKTDLILLNYFDWDKMKALKSVIASNPKFADNKMLERILRMKWNQGLFQIYKLE